MPQESAAPQTAPLGYLELLCENHQFRRLWLGQVVSQTGDWFNTIALFQIALALTGSGRMVALILTVRFLTTVFVSPLAGVIADRFNRRLIMLTADLFRVVVVLGFLLVRQAEDVWLIYVLTVLQLAASTVYEPARSAAIPSVVAPQDLPTANAITATTWSSVLTLGAAAGGLVAAGAGTDAAFVIDSATYLLSAWFVFRLVLPPRPLRERQKLTLARVTGLADFYEGLSYVWQRPRVLAAMLAKPAWGIAGGTLTLLAVFGEKVFPIWGSGAIGISVLYVVRGVGTGISPIFLRKYLQPSRENLETAVGVSFIFGGICFALFGATCFYPLAIFWLFLGYAGGSAAWVNSALLLQMSVADNFRGRVFAAELALLTLILAISNYAAGELLDRFHFSPQTVAVGLGIAATVPGLLWFATRKYWQKDTAEV